MKPVVRVQRVAAIGAASALALHLAAAELGPLAQAIWPSTVALALAVLLATPAGSRRRILGAEVGLRLGLALVLLFSIEQLFVPIGLRLGGLYLTSGTARFGSRALLPLWGMGWLAAAFALGLLMRGLLLSTLERRAGGWVALGGATIVETLLVGAGYFAQPDLDGTDRLYLVLLLPAAGALLGNALYLRTRSVAGVALLQGATWFVEHHLLCDARLDFLPLGYIVTGADWVYPLRLACRAVPAALIVVSLAARVAGRRRHGERLESA